MQGKVTVTMAALLLAGCAGSPAVVGDRASPKFRADLKACRATSEAAVTKQDAKFFTTWLKSPFTSPGQVRRAVRACMVAKGYPAVHPGAA
jgi:hypothetical protein